MAARRACRSARRERSGHAPRPYAAAGKMERRGSRRLIGRRSRPIITEIDLAPDAMLIDFQLDNGELGTEVIKRLRSLIGRVPTRLITANRNIDVQALSANIGVEVLNKPIDPISLHLFLETAGSRN